MLKHRRKASDVDALCLFWIQIRAVLDLFTYDPENKNSTIMKREIRPTATTWTEENYSETFKRFEQLPSGILHVFACLQSADSDFDKLQSLLKLAAELGLINEEKEMLLLECTLREFQYDYRRRSAQTNAKIMMLTPETLSAFVDRHFPDGFMTRSCCLQQTLAFIRYVKFYFYHTID